jgi:hypothetical protein
MSGRNHALLGLFTCGLWLVVAPAIYWARRRAFKSLAAWTVAWIALFGIGSTTGENPPGSKVAVVRPSVTGTARGLVGSTPDVSPRRARTPSSASRRPSTSTPPKPKTTTARPRTSTKAKTKTSSTAPRGLDPQFSTCAKAKAAGYGPYYEGQDPEYAWYRDGDNDGIACD